ncbi:CAP domain-containing protein [Thiothrix subterranea]|nr:CAP domain-containing protein [Thiothrix subterranea]
MTGVTASLLLTACQEGELVSHQGTALYQDMAKRLAVQVTQPLLGQPPVLSDTVIYEAEGEPQYAWRVPSSNTGGWSVNTTNRQLARAFYNSVYSASLNTPIGWTGNHAGCVAGTTSSDFKNSVLARINYFRAMAGVPANITLDSTYSAKAQQAALMMSANNTLSHEPPSSWNCYTADGRAAAESSNISLGHNGWDAVGGQMRDNGSNNTAVGHRRWLLLPQTQRMGAGDVPASGSFSPANAVWVFDGNTFAARPSTHT